MHKLLLTASVVFVLAIAGLAQQASGQGISPFSKTGAGIRWMDSDRKLLNENRDKLLSSKETDAQRRWKNPETGTSVFARLTRAFTKNGLSCREIRFQIDATNKTRHYTVPYCQVQDGSWKIAF